MYSNLSPSSESISISSFSSNGLNEQYKILLMTFASSCVSYSLLSIEISEELFNIAFDNSLINLVLPLPFSPMIQNTLLETDIGNVLSFTLN